MRIAFTHNLQTSHDEEQAEFDREETVAAIADALRSLGHDVARVNVGGASASDLVRRLEELTPDKQLTKMLVSHHAVPTPKWIFVEDRVPDQAAFDALTFPVIVKPNYE